MKQNRVSSLVECAIMIALACVLSLITFTKLPFGGSLTLCSMLPIIIAGYRNGPKFGMLSGAVYGVLQLLVLGGLSDIKGISAGAAIGSIVFDFLIAFGVLGLSGMFRKSVKNNIVSFGLGTVVVILLRYLSHIVSGAIFFGQWAEWFFTEGGGASFGAGILESFSGAGLSVIYSVIYNGLYMIPELIVETIVAFAIAPLLAKIPQRD